MDLDKLLTPAEAAVWLRMQPRTLSAKSRGFKPAIPAIRLSQNCTLYHPRTILAKFAADAGVSREVIAASLMPLGSQVPTETKPAPQNQ